MLGNCIPQAPGLKKKIEHEVGKKVAAVVLEVIFGCVIFCFNCLLS